MFQEPITAETSVVMCHGHAVVMPHGTFIRHTRRLERRAWHVARALEVSSEQMRDVRIYPPSKGTDDVTSPFENHRSRGF